MAPDALEPNDSTATATLLRGDPEALDLTLTAGDVDVFKVEVGGPSQLLVDLRFFHGLGDIDAVLTQGSLSGAAVVNGVSGDDNEQLELTSLADGNYYLKVYGYEGASNAYSLSVQLETGIPVAAEAPVMEPNEAPRQAPVVAIPFARAEGLSIADRADLDDYAFDSDGGTRSLTLSFDSSLGDLDLFVEDASRQVVATSNGMTDVERIVQVFGSGRYFVKVVGYDGATGAFGLQLD